MVLVMGAAGVGKSRLRYEFVRRIAAARRGEVLFGRGDPMSAGSPFGMLGRRSAARPASSTASRSTVRSAKLRARVARHVPIATRPRVADVPRRARSARRSPTTTSVQLRAARARPAC